MLSQKVAMLKSMPYIQQIKQDAYEWQGITGLERICKNRLSQTHHLSREFNWNISISIIYLRCPQPQVLSFKWSNPSIYVKECQQLALWGLSDTAVFAYLDKPKIWSTNFSLFCLFVNAKAWGQKEKKCKKGNGYCVVSHTHSIYIDSKYHIDAQDGSIDKYYYNYHCERRPQAR